ncbi:DUF5131 family protein [Brevibacillus panacihumi]|uniref:DUF5131 family protein n=1 Tax=Brevibacillus panacihumi TaxID=497735 RepID=UPI003CFE3C62
MPGWRNQNIWLGVSVENKKTVDERILLLLETLAAIRFLSCESLLGQVDLEWPEILDVPEEDLYCCNGNMFG